jgi:hypothetical protein
MSVIPSLTILSEEQKFNGDNLLQWNTHITQLLGAKGLLGYIDGKIMKPAQPPTTSDNPATATTSSTPIYSTTPTLDEWNFRDQVTKGHIILNFTDVAGLGIISTGTAKDTYNSIQNEWGKSTDMRRSHAQEALNRTEYAEGTDIQEHIKLLRTRKAALDNLCTQAMSDETWRGIIIRSIPPTAKWLPVIPSLYAMPTSADITSTLFAHGMILARQTGDKTTAEANPTNMALAARTTEGCANPKCKANNRSTHTTDNCYWPGGGKEGQFPPNFGQRSKASTATVTSTSSLSTQTGHFALTARAPKTAGHSGILIDATGTTTTQNHAPAALQIVSRHWQSFRKEKIPTAQAASGSDPLFTEYRDKPTASQIRDSAKAREQEVKYAHRDVPHMPTLNASLRLVSVSDLDNAGFITTFSNGQGIARRADGTTMLFGDIYLLEVEHQSHRTSASVGEQLSTPLTELESTITLPNHGTRFTNTTSLELGNTTTTTDRINDVADITVNHWHHSPDHHQQDIQVAVIPVKSQCSIMIRVPESSQAAPCLQLQSTDYKQCETGQDWATNLPL